MKDKHLRKALGIHGCNEDLCGCSMGVTYGPDDRFHSWHGEIPQLWARVEEVESKIKAIEKKKGNNAMEREKKLERIILDLVQKVRLYHEKYGQEYPGGKPFHFIIHEIEDLGIET